MAGSKARLSSDLPRIARAAQGDHEFFGRHLLANYVACCPKALADNDGLIEALEAAVKAAGATLLRKATHSFSPHGLTAVFLLSESHASIHTYPEHGACFVDLFTCGHACSAERFDAALRDYLRPAEVQCRLVLRNQIGIDEAERLALQDSRPAQAA